jgi:hypothetical protein
MRTKFLVLGHYDSVEKVFFATESLTEAVAKFLEIKNDFYSNPDFVVDSNSSRYGATVIHGFIGDGHYSVRLLER